jgi:hypothetical protein
MADHDEELIRLVSQFRLHRIDWMRSASRHSKRHDASSTTPRLGISSA